MTGKIRYSKNRGFTLLELLIVIAVIGLLASAMMVTFPSSMKSVRDGIRKHDLSIIRAALEQYWDIYGHYPPEGLCIDTSVGSAGCSIPNPPQSYWASNSDLQDLVAEKYLGKIPVDPLNNSTYYYYYEPDSKNQGGCKVNSCQWVLCARLETTGSWYCIHSVRDAKSFPNGGF